MSLPINGRIAIIDDQITQAVPLMKILAQRQLPYTYFSGEIDFLPKEGENKNDIRLLFLDINLIDDGERSNKELKSSLVPVLKRVVSEDNYPYLVVYWSRHDHHTELIENDIFRNDLSTRRPIAFISANKADYFNMDGTQTNDYEEKVELLFTKINDQIEGNSPYNDLLNWENKVHSAADSTLEGLFKLNIESDEWAIKSTSLLDKLGKSYSGKKFNALSTTEKITSSFNALNSIFFDTLENAINNSSSITPNVPSNTGESIYIINRKLLFSHPSNISYYPGTVINEDEDNLYKMVLNDILSVKKLEDKIGNENPGISSSACSKKCSAFRAEIRADMKKICLITTPLCDYVQDKVHHNKAVRGVMLNEKYLYLVDDRSEAIFISPKFEFNNLTYVVLLHFKYFFTFENLTSSGTTNLLLRARQQLLAEIQSKLARYISRQGILFLDEE